MCLLLLIKAATDDRRQYCTRRLRSLYQATKMLHGKGRYQKRKLDLQQVTDTRCGRQPMRGCTRKHPHMQPE